MTTETNDQKKVHWTAEDRARFRAIREKFQGEKPSPEDLIASGEYEGPTPTGAYFSIRQAIAKLKKAREDAGLSLGDVAKRCGMDKAALSRLEHGQPLNPTLETIWRYAYGIGLEVVWMFRPAAIEPVYLETNGTGRRAKGGRRARKTGHKRRKRLARKG